jgi:ABC-type Fe3+ transport system permease subunit
MIVLFALPGSVVGMAFIRFFNHPSPFDTLYKLYDSGIMMKLGAWSP